MSLSPVGIEMVESGEPFWSEDGATLRASRGDLLSEGLLEGFIVRQWLKAVDSSVEGWRAEAVADWILFASVGETLLEQLGDLSVGEGNLRGIFSTALIRSFSTLGLSDRAEILRRVTLLAPKLNGRHQDVSGAAWGPLEKTIRDAWAFEIDMGFRLSRFGEVGDRWRRGFIRELRDLGLPERAEGIAFEQLVVDLRDDGGMIDLGAGRSRVLVLRRTDVSPASSLSADQLAVIACEPMSYRQLLEISLGARKILLVRSCEGERVALWPWLHGDPDRLSRQNPGLKFAALDVESLRVRPEALDVTDSIWTVLDRGLEDPHLRRTFGWNSIQPLNERGLSRPRAVIDAIEWFQN